MELTAKLNEVANESGLDDARKRIAEESKTASDVVKEEIQSTAPPPETTISKLLERLSKRIGYHQLLKLAAHRGDVTKAFQEVPERMHLVANQTKLILELIDDFRTGVYRQIPWRSIVLLSAAVLYTVSPADVIPDALLGIGALDDLAVIAVAVRLIRKDLKAYCRFKGYPVEQYFQDAG